MDRIKVVCYKNSPAILLNESKPNLPTFVATVLYFIEEDATLKPCTEIVFDRTQITDYYCPYVSETMFPLIYCSAGGKCVYPATSANFSSMCFTCKAASEAEFLHNKDIQAKLDSLLNELEGM